MARATEGEQEGSESRVFAGAGMRDSLSLTLPGGALAASWETGLHGALAVLFPKQMASIRVPSSGQQMLRGQRLQLSLAAAFMFCWQGC